MDTESLTNLLSKREVLEARMTAFDTLLQIFTAFVAIGVVGEGIYGIKSWFSHRELKTVQREIDIEKDRIEIGKDRDSALEVETLKADITRAKAQAAADRLELEKLKEQQRPRSIRPEQRSVFIEYLKPAKKRPIRVDIYSSNQEAIDYGKQIRECLNSAGFADPQFPEVQRMTGPALNCPNGARVAVSYYSLEEVNADFSPTNQSSANVVNAFRTINVLVCTIIGDKTGQRSGELRVVVSDK